MEEKEEGGSGTTSVCWLDSRDKKTPTGQDKPQDKPSVSKLEKQLEQSNSKLDEKPGIGLPRTAIRSGSRLFSKRFSSTSRFVVSSQVWLHTIPTRDCDVLITFPAKTEDHMLMWLLARLRSRTPELSVHVRHHSNTGVYGFYLTASYEHLLHGAEELAIRKPIKKEFGGGMKEFLFDDQEYFDGIEDPTQFLTSQERQSIVRHMLFNLRAVEGDVLDKIRFVEGQPIVPRLLSKHVAKQVLPLHNIEDLEYLRTNWMQAFFKPQPLERVCDYFGVKIAMYFAYLGFYTKALVLPAFLGCLLWCSCGSDQNADDISFVVFAFFNVLWATVYLEQWKRRSAEYAYQWGTLDREDELLVEPRPLYHGHYKRSPLTGRLEPFYPSWKRSIFRYFVTVPTILVCLSIVFATMWWIFELQDWVDGKIAKGEFLFFFKFLPKILLAVCIGLMDDVYKKVAYWLNDKENYRLDEQYENHLIIKLVLFQFVNSFLSLFYIAFYLQDMDRLKEQLAALLITRQVIGNIKEALVPYIIEKLKLFKIGYEMTEAMSPATLERHMKEITGEFGEEGAGSEDVNNKEEMTEKVGEGEENGEVFTTEGCDETETISAKETSQSEDGNNSSSNNVDQSRGDTLQFERTSSSDGEGELSVHQSGPHLTQAEVEAHMKKYEDTFEDYLEMFIQFGYVTLFSSAFPLAAICALLNNVIEIRSDAFKLCMTFQRPFGQRVENIGTWQDALELLSVVAVMVNCALIGMSGLAYRMFPDLTTAERIVFIVILEHIVLAMKLLLAYAIPDVPYWVAEEKAKLEYLRRDALKRLESKNPSSSGSQPPTPTMTIPTTKSPERETSSQKTAESANCTDAVMADPGDPVTLIAKESGSPPAVKAGDSLEENPVTRRVVHKPPHSIPVEPRQTRPVNPNSKETKID